MKFPVRILQVVTTMNVGGIENLLMNLYRTVDLSKIQFDFLVHRRDEAFFDQEILDKGGRIYRVPSINPFHHRKYLKAIDKFFFDHPEYDIVHTHMNTYSMYVLRAAKKAGVMNRIAHAHTVNRRLELKAIFREYSRIKLTKYATGLIACGEEAGKWLFKGKEFTIMKNPIDTNLFRYNEDDRARVRQRLMVEPETTVIGHVGSFRSVKNHTFLIEIFRAILAKNDNCKLLLIGEGKLKRRVERMTEHLGISEKTIFAGLRTDIHDLMQAMDVFVFPSLYEGFPLVLIEAQSVGLPCVVSECLTQEINITGEIGFLSLNELPATWADKVHSIKARGYRGGTCMQVREAGYDIAKNARWLQGYYLGSETK